MGANLKSTLKYFKFKWGSHNLPKFPKTSWKYILKIVFLKVVNLLIQPHSCKLTQNIFNRERMFKVFIYNIQILIYVIWTFIITLFSEFIIYQLATFCECVLSYRRCLSSILTPQLLLTSNCSIPFLFHSRSKTVSTLQYSTRWTLYNTARAFLDI